MRNQKGQFIPKNNYAKQKKQTKITNDMYTIIE